MYTSPIEQLIHSTVRIECITQHGLSTGSGFGLSLLEHGETNYPCIITNRHVVAGAEKGRLCFTPQGDDGLPQLGDKISWEIDDFEKNWINHPDPEIDLAIFTMAPILQQAKEKNIRLYFILLPKTIFASDELLGTLPTMEEIIMIGYPNGIWDEKHNLPIIRRGITATHPKLAFNGKPFFVIDASCFPGSSGSPIFLANLNSYMNSNGDLCVGPRVALLGILFAGPQHSATGEIVVVESPIDTKPISVSLIPNNLGYAIHASRILDFETLLEAANQ